MLYYLFKFDKPYFNLAYPNIIRIIAHPHQKREKGNLPLSVTSKPRIQNSPFAPQSNNSPVIAIRIRLLLHFGRKGNSAHNPIPKLLIENSLVRVPVVLHNLIQPVDQGLLRRHLNGATAVRKAAQLLL